MNFFKKNKKNKTTMECTEPKDSPTPPSGYEQDAILSPTQQNPSPIDVREDVLLQIPGCRVHLIDGSEALQLAAGDFKVVQVSDNGVPLAMIIRVGQELQWPITKDEPVAKLDARDYLFTLPVKDGDPLSYGVTFSDEAVKSLEWLDGFLKENSCFSASCHKKVKDGINWKEFSPKIKNYNNILSKAIAGATGQIIRGIFKCSNAYANKVQKRGEINVTKADERNGWCQRNGGECSGSDAKKKSKTVKNLARVKKLSKATEKLSKTMLKAVGTASSSAMAPVMKSKPGKAFFKMLPGEVLLASIDAIDKVIDAAEAAEKHAFHATSNAATRAVTERYGEKAGGATKEVLATAGHAVGTAWNVFKFRKALLPSSSITSGILKNALIK